MKVKDLIYLLQTRGRPDDEIVISAVFGFKDKKGDIIVVEAQTETDDADFNMVAPGEDCTNLWLPLATTKNIESIFASKIKKGWTIKVDEKKEDELPF